MMLRATSLPVSRVTRGAITAAARTAASSAKESPVAEKDEAPPAYREEAFWAPFTARDFHEQGGPSSYAFRAASKSHYEDVTGRRVYDAVGGLWCVNAGHGVERIADAVNEQLRTLDFAPTFNMAHHRAYEWADALVRMAPENYRHAFFANSGSEAVESALKIALAYHRANGEPQRRILVGRERAYHGTNFGGMSVGGMTNNRVQFGANLLPNVSHMRFPYTPAMRFSRGLPEGFGDDAEAFANDLRHVASVNGAENIAAVIVEPVMGSGGLFPPPRGYLGRLKDLCEEIGCLLIFDEVITGFGRTGRPFASDHPDFIRPDVPSDRGGMADLVSLAKGLTNGAIPAGAVLAKAHVHDAIQHGHMGRASDATFVDAPKSFDAVGMSPGLFHGYTYAGHPVAAAAGLATIDEYAAEGLFENAAALSPVLEDALHTLVDVPGGKDHIADVRNYGLAGALELKPLYSKVTGKPLPGAAGRLFFQLCFEEGVFVRNGGQGGDHIVFSPPLCTTAEELSCLHDALARALSRIKCYV